MALKPAPVRKRRANASASTMQAVAQAAGVSMITVSRVLSTPDLVVPATRKAVLAAVKKIGYVPNLMAGGLASNKSRIVGAIVPTIDNSIFADTVRGLSDGLAAKGYQLLLGQSNYDLQTEENLIAAFLGRRVDGLVLTGSNHTPITRKRLKANGLPVVETWDLPAKPIDMVAGFSNFEAGRAVGLYLLSRGHTRLCFAGGPDERSAARLEGFCAAAGQVVTHRLETGASFQGGRDTISHFAQAGPMPDAIFFGNDALAAGALLECQRRGIQVPDQLALIGFADLEIAAALSPDLSSVRVPTRQMGEVAARMILERLQPRLLPNTDEPILTGKVQDLGFEVKMRGTT